MVTPRRDSDPSAPVIRHVVHPSDFSEASHMAFAHALKAALIAKGKLSLIHETNDEARDWSDFPGVQETLERWKILAPDSGPDAVSDLGIDVARIIGHGSNPVPGVVKYVQESNADLIVLATRHHGSDWLHRSVSEPIARKSGEMTLFVPADGHGFVSLEDGAVSLRNVLIPVAATPNPGPAIAGAARVVQQLKCEEGTFTLLHVGETEPALAMPPVEGWKWRRLRKSGNVIDTILETAGEEKTDLIVMSIDGRHGFLDALRGSHSERVVRHAPCPFLAIPEHSHAAAAIRYKEKGSDWYRTRDKRTTGSSRYPV